MHRTYKYAFFKQICLPKAFQKLCAYYVGEWAKNILSMDQCHSAIYCYNTSKYFKQFKN